jgi:hypothetical protein
MACAEELVKVVHVLSGRVRLRAPPLAEQREACERVARAIAADGHFARVRVRPATGSIIVEDGDGPIPVEALAEKVRALVAAEHDEQGRPLAARRPDDQPGPTRVAQAVAHAVAGINADVRDALDHRADLGTILPVFFAAAGVAEVARTGEMHGPSWFNLLWWSLRSFMTFNIRAVEEEIQNGAAAPHDSAVSELTSL